MAARLRGGLTEEEHLVRLLGRFGQVVGIGRPSDVARYVGAQRAYLGYVDWQATIEDLMRSARLVVVRTGITPGLLWEVGKAVETLSPDRLLLVVDSAPELAALLDVIRGHHPGTPARLRLGWRRAGSIRGFVSFGDDWVPEMLPVRSSAVWLYGQKTAETYVDIRLARTLRPIFLRHGVAWPRPPVSWEALATFGMLGAVVAAIVVLWLLASLGLITG